MELNEYNLFATEKIAEYLRETMEEKGMSIYKMAEITGLSKPTLYNVFRTQNSKKDYSFGTLLTIMRALNLHLELSQMSPTNNIHTMGNNTPSNN